MCLKVPESVLRCQEGKCFIVNGDTHICVFLDKRNKKKPIGQYMSIILFQNLSKFCDKI